MHKVTCTRRLTFDAGHRVLGHLGKCRSWHGHTYVVELTAESRAAADLDPLGMVVDFSALKEQVGGWVEHFWDHGFIISVDDKQLLAVSEDLGEHKTFVLPANPTAENLALYLLHEVCPKVLKGTRVRVVKVVVHETPNCRAEAAL